MAYIALYRKYRSQTFEDVMGQEHVTRTLQNALERGTVGQAYLFTGSRGTGKTTVARLLAKAVNCEKGPTPHPCNECSMCLAVTQGTAVDVAEVDAASNRGVQEMETICEGVRYQPMEARIRVVILDEAHQLSDHAKDAFLKTLEEPPPHAIFILATTEPAKIPITIRSRCQQFDFHRGTPKQVEDRLRWVCEREGVEIDDAACRLIAAHAQGSWRDGLSLLEQVIAFSGTGITHEEARKVLGAVPREVTEELFASIASGDASGVIAGVRRSWDSGADPARLLAALVELARGRLEELLSEETASEELRRIGADGLIRVIYSLAESEANLRNWQRADLAIEVALLSALTAARARQTPLPDPAQAEPAKADRAQSTQPERPPSVAEPPSTPAAPGEKPDLIEPSAPGGEPDLEMMKRAWPRVIQTLRSDRANTSLCAILKDGSPSGFDDSTLTISYPAGYAFHVQKIQSEPSRQAIERAFETLTGRKIRVQAVVAPETAPRAPAPSKRSSGDEGDGDSEETSDPAPEDPHGVEDLIQKVIETFGGEVLDDSDPYK